MPASGCVYFESLMVENVKAFAGKQVLKLTGNDDVPAPWTLILGDNGLGKTTLLRCLAQMRPVLNLSQEASATGGEPDIIEPALWREDNETLERLARAGHDGDVRLACALSSGRAFKGNSNVRGVAVTLSFRRKKGKIEAPEKSDLPANGFVEPLVLAYGAGRHMGTANVENTDLDPIRSLFSVAAELFDAEEILTRMDHAALREVRDRKRNGPANRQLAKLKRVVATLLPHIDDAENILIYGPKLPGGTQRKTGIFLRTPYGEVPLSEISLGYQTMTAWAVDLAWRLFAHYPNSDDPLSEPAIVLVDEIDLHLHPKWQREIRRDLTEHFPNVQFIVTAHSPLMAQTSLDANLAVLQQENDHVVIINDPAVIADWRLDQIVTSELFGLTSARPPEIERIMEERIALLRKPKLKAAEKARLSTLDRELDELSMAESKEDQRAMALIRRAALVVEQGKAKS
jgi:AAA domain, putative AbiEii toxin, Type IV TA system